MLSAMHVDPPTAATTIIAAVPPPPNSTKHRQWPQHDSADVMLQHGTLSTAPIALQPLLRLAAAAMLVPAPEDGGSTDGAAGGYESCLPLPDCSQPLHARLSRTAAGTQGGCTAGKYGAVVALYAPSPTQIVVAQPKLCSLC
jgi:hypothetical protein